MDVWFPAGDSRFVIVDPQIARSIADSSNLSAPAGVDVDSFALAVTPGNISFSRGDSTYRASGARVLTTAWIRVLPNARTRTAPLRLTLPSLLDGHPPTVNSRSSDLQAGYGMWTSQSIKGDTGRMVSVAELTVHGSRVAVWVALTLRGIRRFALVMVVGTLGVFLVLGGLSLMGHRTSKFDLDQDKPAALPRIPRRA
jgi:hypothetical protein